MATTQQEPKAEQAGSNAAFLPMLDMVGVMNDMTSMTMKIMQGYRNLASLKDEDIAVGSTPRELVFEQDGIKLYRYVQENTITCKTPVLVCYALVNKEYLLDLQPDRSYVKNLLQNGHDVYIIDWGYPTRANRYRTVDDYIDIYLNDCVDAVRRDAGVDKITLMGVCQGGTLSIIYTALYPHKIKNLVTLITPVDFSTNDGTLFAWAKYMDPNPVADVGNVSGDTMNNGFLMVKPMQRIDKFHAFANMMDDKAKMTNFLRMERWIFDSPSQAGECYRKFISELYLKNSLVKNELEIGGRTVNLQDITMPVLTVYAKQDHIVPPSSTKPLNDLVGSKDKEMIEFPGGHAGVFVSSQTQKMLAPAVSKWLHNHD
jgi:polyhydroxyalkanoate synthase